MSETVASLIADIKNRMDEKGMSVEDFAAALNKYLPKKHRKEINKSRMVTVYRWFAGSYSPQADVVLAMHAWYKANKNV